MRRQAATEGLPPGPTAPPFAQSLAFARDPVQALLTARAHFGTTFTLRFMSAGPAVVIADPDDAERMINSDPRQSHAGEARRKILPQASPRSMFGGDGKRHHDARQSVAPAFAAERIARQEDAMREIAEAHVKRWPAGRPFRLLPRMRTLVEEIFVRLVLGVTDDARASALVGAMRRLLWTPGNPPLLPPDRDTPILGPAVDWMFQRRLKPVAQLLTKEVEARRERSPTGDGILDLLAHAEPRLTAAEIVDGSRRRTGAALDRAHLDPRAVGARFGPGERVHGFRLASRAAPANRRRGPSAAPCGDGLAPPIDTDHRSLGTRAARGNRNDGSDPTPAPRSPGFPRARALSSGSLRKWGAARRIPSVRRRRPRVHRRGACPGRDSHGDPDDPRKDSAAPALAAPRATGSTGDGARTSSESYRPRHQEPVTG